MKLQSLLSLVGLITVQHALAGTAAYPDPKAPKNAVSVAPDVSRWSLSAGIVFRPMEATFSLHSQLSPSGLGNVGLQHAGANRINYDDGWVGPGYGVADGNTPDGSTYTRIDHRSQLTRTGRRDSVGTPIYNLAFHTETTIDSVSHTTDSDVGIGPSLELRYAIFQGAAANVNLLLGYSLVSANFGTGPFTTGQVSRLFTYNYDYDAENSGALGASYSFRDGAYAAGNVAGSYFNDGKWHNPRMTQARAVSNDVFITRQAHLDLDLHEVVLAPEYLVNLGKKIHVGLSVGPTLNFINSSFNASASVHDRSTGQSGSLYHIHDSGTDVALGVASQLTLMVDITKKIFLQASGSYRFVQTVDVGTGLGSAAIDTTSWQSTVGLGFKF